MRSTVPALLLTTLSAIPSVAQLQVTPSANHGEPVTLNFKLGPSRLSTITGRPYSAIDSMEETLSNGGHVSIRSDPFYRDSAGRTRTEHLQVIPGAGLDFLVIQILDPASGSLYVLDPAHQIVHRLHTEIASKVPGTPKECPVSQPKASAMAEGITATNESLGAREFDGVRACGTRVTLTYPIGFKMFGNDRPLSLVSEDWPAFQELGKMLRSTSNQPNSYYTQELKNLRLAEPDAALFQLPAGYRIVDESAEFTITVAPATTSSKTSPRRITALTGLAYSAEQVLATQSKLSDGTQLSRDIGSTLYYRDAMGRTRVERPGISNPIVPKIEIVDAVAGYSYALDPDKHTAKRTPLAVQFKPADTASIPAPISSTTQERLGTQTIDGMMTYGVRNTTTLPAGSVGSDRPLTFVNESWIAPRLGIALISKSSDTRSADSTTNIRNLKFAEPDAGLFRVPEGYRVVDDPDFAVR